MIVAVAAAALAAGCRTDRLRPGPPAVSIGLGQVVATPTDTVAGTVSASSPEGLDSVFLIVGAEVDGVDGRFDRDLQFTFRWDLEGGFAAGDSVYFTAVARDARGFSARDSQLVRIQ